MNHVFLSYSPRDVELAAQVRDELRREGVGVWWEEEILPDENWATEVGAALDRSDSVVVLVSPDAMDSDVVQRELRYALANSRLRERVFPAMIRPTWIMPWRFRRLPLYDLTKTRTRELKKIVKAIKTPRRPEKAAG